ncbi:MAG: hypothetical protein EPO35_11610 [Acidobacteria bacterium]|nr:MAG: hypothetical protein EPO35_11610 [Acidobacteriota bacterium]
MSKRLTSVLVLAASLALGSVLAAQQFGGPPAPTAVVNPTTDPLLQGFRFRNIGPAVMGGRVDDIEGAEKDPLLIYVGFATGGLWKSTDGGFHFTSQFDEMPHASVGDIAIAPSNPDVVYVGMGEPNNRQSSSIGNGVYGTKDGGKTWLHLGLEDTQSIGRIAVSPTDPNTVFVAAVGHLFGPNEERGLYKSIDGGKTWKKAKYIDADTGFTDVAIDPLNPKVVYAASYMRRRTWWGFNGGGANSGLWKSMDAGETWTKITGGGFPAPTDGIIGRIGISIYKAKPSTIFMIAEVGAEAGIQVGVGDNGLAGNSGDAQRTQNGGPTRSGVWRTDDAGKTWTFLSNVNNRPIYYSQIRVDPTNDKKLFQGGATAMWSNDGGKTWQAVRGTGHGDYHAIWINPKDSRNMMVGHDGGLDVSNDGGLTWDYRNKIVASQFYQISADMRRPYVVCGGLQDNGSWCGPSAVRAGLGPVNTDWYRVGGGDGFYTRQDPTDWAVVYSESQNGSMSRYDLRSGTQKSVRPNAGGAGGRGGASNITNNPGNLGELRFYWNTPIELSPFDPSTVYTGAQYFMKSTNRGDTWTVNPKDLSNNVDRFGTPIMGVAGNAPMASKHDGYSNNSLITVIGESPAKRGVIWVGTDDGNLQLSLDGGNTFTNVIGNISGAPKGAVQVSRVVPSAFDGGTAYVALDNHRNDDWKPYIFKTTDYGKTWASVTGNLPAKGNVNALREDDRNANLLFAGTEFALYVSLDGGKEWKKFMPGLPSVRIDDILIHPRDRDLIIATHGRGIWILDDITPLEQMASSTSGTVKLFESRAGVQWKNDTRMGRSVPETEFKGTNPAPGTAISFWAASDLGEAKIEIVNAGGQVVRTINTTAKAGLNRVMWNLAADPPGGPAPAGAGAPGAAGGGRGAGGGGQGGGGGRGGFPGGNTAAPGAYLIRLTAGGQTLTSSVVVLEDIWMLGEK